MPGERGASSLPSDRARGADHRLDGRAGDAAGAQQGRGVGAEVDNRRFKADGAWPTVEDGVDLITQAGLYVGGCGWADVAGAVGAGGGDWVFGGFDQGVGEGVIGDAHGQGVETGTGE